MNGARDADETIDVRDMTCAQALARVSQSFAALPPGAVAAIRCTTDDVRDDVRSWARALAHPVVASDRHDDEWLLWIKKSP